MTLPLPLQIALRGADPRLAQTASFAEDPLATAEASASPSASILFPPPQNTGILTPEDRATLKRNAILQVAASLLQAGGRSPNQRGTLANVGAALAGLDLPGAAQSALRMRAVTDELNQQAAARTAMTEIVKRHVPIPGETPDQRFQRYSDIINELIGVPGSDKLIGDLSNVLTALRPERGTFRDPLRIADVRDTLEGSPTKGQIGTILLDPVSRERIGFIPQVQPEKQQVRPLSSTERTRYRDQAEYTATALAAWRPLEQIREANPNVEVEVGRILTSPDFIKAIPGLHNAGDAALAVQKAGGSAAAQRYIRAKMEFLGQVERMNYTGARGITGILQSQFYQRFMPGLDELSNAQMRQNELNALASGQGTAGIDDYPEFWQRSAKRHGVSGIDIEHLLQGGSLDPQMDQIRNRYPIQ